MIIVKTLDEMKALSEAGHKIGPVFDYIKPFIKPGVTTKEIDKLCEKFIRSSGCTPSFKGFEGFPGSICASVNDEVIHGIPSSKRVLKEGDLLKIDIGNIDKSGYQGDCARTFFVGEVSKEAKLLAQATEEAFWEALKVVKPGARVNDIGYAIQKVADSYGFSALSEYGGHGIGVSMHEDPFIPNCSKGYLPHRGQILREGMAICIEPMLILKRPQIYIADDDWTVISQDHSLGAHYENTILIYSDYNEVTTVDNDVLKHLQEFEKGVNR